jgi:hypothetical protein
MIGIHIYNIMLQMLVCYTILWFTMLIGIFKTINNSFIRFKICRKHYMCTYISLHRQLIYDSNYIHCVNIACVYIYIVCLNNIYNPLNDEDIWYSGLGWHKIVGAAYVTRVNTERP